MPECIDEKAVGEVHNFKTSWKRLGGRGAKMGMSKYVYSFLILSLHYHPCIRSWFRLPLVAGFSGSSHTGDLKIGAPLPGAWRYRVSDGTGRPGVSIL